MEEVYDLINNGVDCAYFRKANFIYGYFNHLIDHDTECAIVSVADMRDFLNTCIDVYNKRGDTEFARERLPTYVGFFFGTYDYDEWYYAKVKYAIDSIGAALKGIDADEECFAIWFSW